ncbi:MAG: DUF523 and DUF1722 domain-containing protein [Planctomycetota bacterium]
MSVAAWSRWTGQRHALRLGVSACLLGQEVRFDGGHARSRFVTDRLAEFADLFPVCPELDAGLGVPRPAIRLVEGEDGDTRLCVTRTGEDLTERFLEAAERRIGGMNARELDGFVVKKSSPSCGMERLRVHGPNGPRHRNGVGLFTQRLMERHPLLPIEEDGRLQDPALRERFVLRAFCRSRWRALRNRGLSRNALVRFHTAHKLLLRTHDERQYQELGRLVSSFGTMPDEEIYRRYEVGFQRALMHRATRGRHTNALQHALGFLKDRLAPIAKRELLTTLEDYRQGFVPLIVPVSLLRAHVRDHDVPYLDEQIYLDPYPKELMLRNAS